MSRASIARIRRSEFQKAAFEVACKYGLNQLTIEKVARHAGSSKGAVHHYFEGKRELIEHAIRFSHAVLARAARAKLRRARSPSERIWAIVEANFLPEVMVPEFYRLWFEALEYPQFSRLIDVFERRMRSNMVFALKMLVEPARARDIAFAIMNLYDGYWTLASTNLGITRNSAMKEIALHIKDLVPGFDMSVAKFDG